ncbi:hypothetical protein N7513_009877 [Penicillium frequentans]|nr:hypothetical protein N7513_009877 [Penicillium glabrum]
MDDINQSKPNTESFEVVKPIALQQLPLPEELASWDSHDLEKLEKRLVRKLDCCLLPAVIILFLMNILDRNNIANAKIVGLPETLGISDAQYNVCLMIFYVGYILTQLPSNLITTKLKPSIYIGTTTAAWGIVSMCQAFTHNFAGLKRSVVPCLFTPTSALSNSSLLTLYVVSHNPDPHRKPTYWND